MPDGVSGQQRSRQLLLRHSLLTLAVFIPLLGAFVAGEESYPVSYYSMFHGASALGKGNGFQYFVFRGETASGEIVEIAPITLMNGMDDRIWTMVRAVVANESLELHSAHPANTRLTSEAGGIHKLPRGALLPDLLRVWGDRYNARLAVNSPDRLIRAQMDEYKWPEREYGNYSEPIQSWRVDL
jgi:hypothetical protein